MEHVNNNNSNLFDILERQKITDLTDGEIIFVNAVKEANTKYGPTFICLDTINNKIVWANNSLKGYINKIIHK